jgi:hypothetical protein
MLRLFLRLSRLVRLPDAVFGHSSIHQSNWWASRYGACIRFEAHLVNSGDWVGSDVLLSARRRLLFIALSFDVRRVDQRAPSQRVQVNQALELASHVHSERRRRK